MALYKGGGVTVERPRRHQHATNLPLYKGGYREKLQQSTLTWGNLLVAHCTTSPQTQAPADTKRAV